MGFRSKLHAIRSLFGLSRQIEADRIRVLAAIDEQKRLTGRLFAETNATRTPDQLADIEFQVFSQWGDDGIIQWLIRQVEIPNLIFVEFGVEDYVQSNTLFLLLNNNWRGLVLDSSEENVRRIRATDFYWQHDLTARAAFVTAENINSLFAQNGFSGDVGLLHIDIDGNDYWIWRAVVELNPRIVVMEYNAVFGSERPITIPYVPDFSRLVAHSSGIYAGASLGALRHLAAEKGYTFVGCNGAGNNAYFLRNDVLTSPLRALADRACFVNSRFRESRGADGKFSFVAEAARESLIRGLPVMNVATMTLEQF